MKNKCDTLIINKTTKYKIVNIFEKIYSFVLSGIIIFILIHIINFLAELYQITEY